MRNLAFFLVLGIFCGCAGAPFTGKKELISVEVSLKQKESRIRELEALLAQKEIQIKEKEVQIQQLKDKLRGFGVF